VKVNEAEIGARSGIVGPRERRTTWDLNLDGALGRLLTDPGQWTGFGRVRGGILHIRDSLYFSLGLTYEISDKTAATFGLQGEVMHLESGFWLQVGGLLDIQPKPGVMASVGWSILGFEFQYRNYEDTGPVAALFGKIRIPLRIIFLATEK
jgi:hypothetical protein